MNRNKNLKKEMMTGIAVGMAGIMGAVPVFAAEDSVSVTKEETVYVNAQADGTETKITVSEWLKNAGIEKELEDQSQLSDIINVKGDETFLEAGNQMTWNTDGKDIYYQGTGEKELPVSVRFTYYLNGKQMAPQEMKGKSGKLKIRINYENREKKTVTIDGKKETVYTPFVLATGLILPEDHYTNVMIDNGKVISDGQRHMVFGVGMPGLKESLGFDDPSTESFLKDVNLPESLEITADVTDFVMDPTFTVALSDMMDALNLDDTKDLDEVLDDLNDLEDAALKIVDGSSELSDGTTVLHGKYQEFDQGIQTLKGGIDALNNGAAALSGGINSYTDGADQLNSGIQDYMGSNGKLNVQVTEYVNGVSKIAKGVQDYTEGTLALTDGVEEYLAGEQKLADGAVQLDSLKGALTEVKKAISTLNGVLDGKGTAQEDVYTASQLLASGIKQLNDSLSSMSGLLGQVDQMITTGKNLTAQAGAMSQLLKENILVPAESMLAAGNQMTEELQAIGTQLAGLKEQCNAAVQESASAMTAQVNQQIESKNGEIQEKNAQIQTLNQSAAAANGAIDSAIQQLNEQIAAASAAEQPEIAGALSNIVGQLSGAKVNAGVDGISALEGIAEPGVDVALQLPDIQGIKGTVDAVGTQVAALEQAAGALEPKLEEMTEQLDQIASMKDGIPTAPMDTMKKSVSILNAGAQELNGAIGALSAGMGMLDEKTNELPKAIEGIDKFTAGITELSKYNPILLNGIQQLKENTPALIKGMDSLSAGTLQLNQGLTLLGGRLSGGAAKLAENSDALRAGAGSLTAGVQKLTGGSSTLQSASGQVISGISALENGALELKDGTVKFNEEGIQKLQESADELLGTLWDRFEVLTSDTCSYDTYGGKAKDMDGTVKFVIQTEGIE